MNDLPWRRERLLIVSNGYRLLALAPLELLLVVVLLQLLLTLLLDVVQQRLALRLCARYQLRIVDFALLLLYINLSPLLQHHAASKLVQLLNSVHHIVVELERLKLLQILLQILEQLAMLHLLSLLAELGCAHQVSRRDRALLTPILHLLLLGLLARARTLEDTRRCQGVFVGIAHVAANKHLHLCRHLFYLLCYQPVLYLLQQFALHVRSEPYELELAKETAHHLQINVVSCLLQMQQSRKVAQLCHRLSSVFMRLRKLLVRVMLPSFRSIILLAKQVIEYELRFQHVRLTNRFHLTLRVFADHGNLDVHVAAGSSYSGEAPEERTFFSFSAVIDILRLPHLVVTEQSEAGAWQTVCGGAVLGALCVLSSALTDLGRSGLLGHDECIVEAGVVIIQLALSKRRL